METAKIITENLINRAKNLQQFTVFRNLERFPFSAGHVPFDIRHVVGYPMEFDVPALSQQEAEERVDAWLNEIENHDE
jgi:hypothetical protein